MLLHLLERSKGVAERGSRTKGWGGGVWLKAEKKKVTPAILMAELTASAMEVVVCQRNHGNEFYQDISQMLIEVTEIRTNLLLRAGFIAMNVVQMCMMVLPAGWATWMHIEPQKHVEKKQVARV